MHTSDSETSDFGRGFLYPLILFAMHCDGVQYKAAQYQSNGIPVEEAYSIWFYGAADHLLEMEIPEALKDSEIGLLAESLRGYVLDRRMKYDSTDLDYKTALSQLRHLAFLIDQHFGHNPVRATWE